LIPEFANPLDTSHEKIDTSSNQQMNEDIKDTPQTSNVLIEAGMESNISLVKVFKSISVKDLKIRRLKTLTINTMIHLTYFLTKSFYEFTLSSIFPQSGEWPKFANGFTE
jgi:hypothetical protein